jgi:aspartyl-tRNA synthetase
MRTHLCGELRPEHIGETVSVCGWVGRRREHGEHLAFVDLRDHSGIVQCVINDDVDVRSEYVLRITGVVRDRPRARSTRTCRPAGSSSASARSRCSARPTPPPFPIDARADDVDENIRLQHRYLDLRRERMQKNLRSVPRSTPPCATAMERQGFVEVETPMLVPSTPEGAREFLVPSRKEPGSFYALPQSPQLFKQLLMVGGVDRYYQIARCLRDEDLRADRQYEFMQLDMEMSFVTQDDVLDAVSAKRCSTPPRRHGRAPAADRADHVARGDGPLRHRQARPALRDGAGRADDRVRVDRVQGVRRRRAIKGIRVRRRRRRLRPQPARQADRSGQVARRQGPRLAEGHRRRLRLTGRQVPLRRRGHAVRSTMDAETATWC